MKKYIIVLMLMLTASWAFAHHSVVPFVNKATVDIQINQAKDSQILENEAVPVIVKLIDPKTGEAYAECAGLLYTGGPDQPAVVILTECWPVTEL